jgi:cellulose synthase/poly-beta-1,6-N-acetylglucosamine synthase-like glycosyltransferase
VTVEADRILAELAPAPLHPGLVALAAAALFLAATYLVWPALLLLRAWLLPRPPRPVPGAPLPSVTCVVAAHDEGEGLVAKVEGLLALDYPRDLLDVVVADDASTDGAPARARALDPGRVAVASTPARAGKPSALVRAVALARGEVLLLCDARQRFDPAAARALVRPLADPRVGVVTGRLRLDGARGPGAYWLYETAIRIAEGRTGSVMGATGAIYAIRRALFPRALPPETILDDVLVPMTAVLAGHRVAYAEDAVAWDHELELGREFVRKVRTLAGGWQLLALLPALRNPLGGGAQWRFFWHKTARLLCPVALAVAFLGSLAAPGLAAEAALAAQLVLYGLAGLDRLAPSRAGRAASLCHTFVALHAAAVAGLVAWGRGRAGAVWVRTGAVGTG